MDQTEPVFVPLAGKDGAMPDAVATAAVISNVFPDGSKRVTTIRGDGVIISDVKIPAP